MEHAYARRCVTRWCSWQVSIQIAFLSGRCTRAKQTTSRVDNHLWRPVVMLDSLALTANAVERLSTLGGAGRPSTAVCVVRVPTLSPLCPQMSPSFRPMGRVL